MDCFDYLEQAFLQQTTIGTSPWYPNDFEAEIYYGSWSKVLAEEWTTEQMMAHEF